MYDSLKQLIDALMIEAKGSCGCLHIVVEDLNVSNEFIDTAYYQDIEILGKTENEKQLARRIIELLQEVDEDERYELLNYYWYEYQKERKAQENGKEQQH